MCAFLIALVIVLPYYRMRSLPMKCVLFLWNVFSYDRMYSLTIECVLLR